MDPLKDDEYYLEDGKFVLTERYLSRRGYCCGSGCRHCPYGHERVPPATREKIPPPRPYFAPFSEGEGPRPH